MLISLISRSLCTAACLLTAAWIVVLGGCTARMHSFQIPLEGAEALGSAPIRVEVENARGSVVVEAWNGSTEPQVVAVAHTASEGPHAPVTWDGEDGSAAVATIDRSGPIPTLRVRAEPAGAQQVDVLIRAPSIDGVVVRSAGGEVDLIRVRGPISVSNSSVGLGAPAKHLASIRVRTDHDLREGVTLVTDRGEVSCVVGPGSAGRVDMRTADGDARWTTEGARVTEHSALQGHYVGTLNAGNAPFTMRTEQGEVRLVVLPDAGGLVLERHTPRWERWAREGTLSPE